MKVPTDRVNIFFLSVFTSCERFTTCLLTLNIEELPEHPFAGSDDTIIIIIYMTTGVFKIIYE